jgi:hypothetical protein
MKPSAEDLMLFEDAIFYNTEALRAEGTEILHEFGKEYLSEEIEVLEQSYSDKIKKIIKKSKPTIIRRIVFNLLRPIFIFGLILYFVLFINALLFEENHSFNNALVAPFKVLGKNSDHPLHSNAILATDREIAGNTKRTFSTHQFYFYS